MTTQELIDDIRNKFEIIKQVLITAAHTEQIIVKEDNQIDKFLDTVLKQYFYFKNLGHVEVKVIYNDLSCIAELSINNFNEISNPILRFNYPLDKIPPGNYQIQGSLTEYNKLTEKPQSHNLWFNPPYNLYQYNTQKSEMIYYLKAYMQYVIDKSPIGLEKETKQLPYFRRLQQIIKESGE